MVVYMAVVHVFYKTARLYNSSLVIFLSFESTSHWTLTQGQVLSSPFDSAILEPDFNLGFIQTQVSREIEPL